MNEIIKNCPFLGMANDPATNTSFPSLWNHCHHVKPVEIVKLNHQNDYCLSEKHIECPVYLRKEKTSLPVRLRAPHSQFGKESSFNWKKIFLILIFVAALVLAAIRFSLVEQIIPMTDTLKTTWAMEMELTADAQVAGKTVTQTPLIRPTETESSLTNNTAFTQMAGMATEITPSPISIATNTITLTKTLNPTWTQTPTRTFSPTRTNTPTRTYTPTQSPMVTSTLDVTSKPFLRALDIPIGSQKLFVIHKVKSGENLSQYATSYKTSAEAILQVNYSLMIPLLVDTLVVIPVDFTAVAQMPYFQPYRVTTDAIAIEAFAKELGTDLNDFIYYNGFEFGELLKLGDWILVPRLQSAN